MIAVNGLHPALRPYAEWALSIAEDAGIPVTVTSVKRDWAKQTALRANYEACVARGVFPSSLSLSPGMTCKYPANRPGDSAHNFGLAWDSWVPPEYQADWNAIRRWIGWRVPENDLIHAEFSGWRDLPPELLKSFL